MDWPREKIGISDKDLENVFKYEPKKTRVVRLEGSRSVSLSTSQSSILR